MKAVITGSCLCKAVQYRIASAIAMAVNCHCNSCKKASGGAFASLAVVKEKHLEITSGKECLVTYQRSESVAKLFCGCCGTPIFNAHKMFPGNRMLPVGAFDVPELATPAINVHCENMLPWVKDIAETKCFDKEFTR